MKSLILIHGATQQTVEEALRECARLLQLMNDDRHGGITSLKLHATRHASTFALRVGKLCGEWDFVGLCLTLPAVFNLREVQLEAWFRTENDSTGCLPYNKMLYVRFGAPRSNDISLIDKNGNRYLFADAIDEESGVETLDVVQDGTDTYKPYPKLQLVELPKEQGHITVVEPTLRNKLANVWDWCLRNGLATLLATVLMFAVILLAITGVRDYSETLLPFSLPWWTAFAAPLAAGAVWAIRMALCKDFNILGHMCLGAMATALTIGLVMVFVFSVNAWFESSDEIHGLGIVTHVERNRGDNPVYKYQVDALSPKQGKLTIRMDHDCSFAKDDTVSVTLHRGLYGILHAEKIGHAPQKHI